MYHRSEDAIDKDFVGIQVRRERAATTRMCVYACILTYAYTHVVMHARTIGRDTGAEVKVRVRCPQMKTSLHRV